VPPALFLSEKKMEKLKGTKVNMSQIFLDNGKVVPVTVVLMESYLTDDLLNKEVTVVGTSKGKGFSGGIKRWGFRKQGETRGAKNKVRALGSIGAQTPGRVFPGKKMAGRHGNYRVTIKGLKIVNVDSKNKQIMVSGPVPGARHSQLTITVL